jgi:hypothetical protein
MQQAVERKNAQIIYQPTSGGTQGQGHVLNVAPRASYAFGFSHHAAKHLPLTRQTGRLVPSDKKPATGNSRTEQRSIIMSPE